MSFLAPFASSIIGAAGSLLGNLSTKSAINSAVGDQVGAATQIGQKNAEASSEAIGDVNNATTQANSGLTAATDQGNQILQGTTSQQLAALQPYLSSGTTSLQQLQSILGPNGSLNGPGSQFNFNYNPNDPGYQFIQSQAQKSLDASAAAKGALLTGGTVRAGERNASNLASTYLDSAFNRALQTYNTNRQNTLSQISGLTGLTGLGFNATGLQNSDLGSLGANLNTNLYRSAAQQGQNTIGAGTYTGNTTLGAATVEEKAIADAANANAAGTLGKANANNSLIGGLTNVGKSLLAPNGPLNFGGGGSGVTGGVPYDPSVIASLP